MIEGIKAGFSYFNDHKLKCILLLLTMSIAVFLLIAVTIINKIVNKLVYQEMKNFGINRVWLYRDPYELNKEANSNPWTNGRQLNNNDPDQLLRYCPFIKMAAPSIRTKVAVICNDKLFYHVGGIATVSDYQIIKNEQLCTGRFLTPLDEIRNNRVCVLSYKAYQSLFNGKSALNKQIVLENEFFTVVGIVKDKDNRLLDIIGIGPVNEEVIFFPLTVIQSTNWYNTWNIQYLDVQVHNESQIEQTIADIHNYLRLCYGTDTKFIVKTFMDKIEHTKKIMSILYLSSAMVILISLFVAGSGIMNMMLASVSERCFEIGIRRAVGAKRADILIQFLIESIIIGLVGGCFGIIGDVAVYYLSQYLLGHCQIFLVQPILLALMVSVLVGILAGIYPARKAANLNPIDAIRENIII